MKKISLLAFVILTVACSGSPDRIVGGTNPEDGALSINPSFSGDIPTDACISGVSDILANSKCWTRGSESDANYTEVWFSPDDSTGKTGVMGFESKTESESRQIDYSVTGCDSGKLTMTEAGGFTVQVGGDNKLDLKFSSWDKAYRYTATSACVLAK